MQLHCTVSHSEEDQVELTIPKSNQAPENDGGMGRLYTFLLGWHVVGC